jgi:hypothetical protein
MSEHIFGFIGNTYDSNLVYLLTTILEQDSNNICGLYTSERMGAFCNNLLTERNHIKSRRRHYAQAAALADNA